MNPFAHPDRLETWTDLVQEDNGTYKQTAQHPELNACLSATVKRANANLVLVDAFPSLLTRDEWVLVSLRMELAARRGSSHFINAVAERVNVDEYYLNCLLAMVTATFSHVRF